MPTEAELLQQIVDLQQQQLEAILWAGYCAKAAAFGSCIGAGFLAALLFVRGLLVRNLIT